LIIKSTTKTTTLEEQFLNQISIPLTHKYMNGSLNTFKLFALSVPDEGNVSCALLSYEIEDTKIHFHPSKVHCASFVYA
jgi:hypothetical protein